MQTDSQEDVELMPEIGAAGQEVAGPSKSISQWRNGTDDATNASSISPLREIDFDGPATSWAAAPISSMSFTSS